MLLKIAPDLTLGDLDDVVGVARRHRVDGMIVCNTTVSRPKLRETAKAEPRPGGLSGRPLFALSTRMLAETFVRAEGAFPLIGVGGIDSGAAAFAKIKAGASLVQLYSGLVFRGVGLVGEIKKDLLDLRRVGRLDSLADAVGRDAATVTRGAARGLNVAAPAPDSAPPARRRARRRRPESRSTVRYCRAAASATTTAR